MRHQPLSLFKAWMRNPLRTASVMPSGRALANLLTVGLGPDQGHIIELGPGTGPVTQAILSRGVHPQDLTAVEISAEFAADLRRKYPGITVLNMGAEDLSAHYQQSAHPAPVIRTIISGLPFLALPNSLIRRILESAFSLLAPEGEFVLFTYGPTLPVPGRIMRELGLTASRRGLALGNVPPATVYCLSRLQSDASP
jgi:phospholipid N-methyltransferase